MTPDWPAILEHLRNAAAVVVEGTPQRAGGMWRAQSGVGALFFKTGPRRSADMFAAEAAGLTELGGAGAVRVPRVYGHGEVGDHAYLAIEWLELAPTTEALDRTFGRQLAALHAVTADAHGWHRDNTIGPTPQINTRTADWTEFFAERRLRFQLEFAARGGFGGELQALGERVAEALPELLAGHDPQPSLLHGDLWGGNYGACAGEPVIFDPAVYYGDRETDLAMTRLFGGFSQAFYAAYEAEWPLPPGHRARLGLYQLYHVLNHLNLFGSGYLSRALGLMRAAAGARG